MGIEQVIQVRRSLLCGALSLLSIAAGNARAARRQPRLSREHALLAEATSYLLDHFRTHGSVLAGPVSLLQRRYSLEYGDALALAAKLEEQQIWSIYRDGAGMRCARRGARALHA